MPTKTSKAQKDVIGRVMHEFKHGELKSSSGQKVRNPKQAIAIALHEGGASNEVSPAKNRANLRRTREREQGKAAGPTRATFYEEAKARKLDGRSRMTKAELQQALKR